MQKTDSFSCNFVFEANVTLFLHQHRLTSAFFTANIHHPFPGLWAEIRCLFRKKTDFITM